MKCCHLFPLTLYILEFFVQDSLCVLNISRSNVDDIRDLRGLRKLQHFSAADNKLQQVAVKATFYLTFLREPGEHNQLVDNVVPSCSAAVLNPENPTVGSQPA